MLRLLVAVVLVCVASEAQAQTGQYQNYWNIHQEGDPQGAEAHRTTQDPGWWQRTWIGWDKNADGQYTGGERGILVLMYDGFMGLMWALCRPLLDYLLNMCSLPKIEAMVQHFAAIVVYFKIANCWLPIDFSLSTLVCYFTVVNSIFVVKMLLKIVRGA